MKAITTFDDKKGTCTAIRSCKKNSRESVATRTKWIYDLATFSKKELKTLAVSALVINTQRLWRAGKVGDEATITRDTFANQERAARQPSRKAAYEYFVSEIAKGRSQDDLLHDILNKAATITK